MQFNDQLRAIKQNADSETYSNAIERASDETRDKFCANGEHIHIEDTIAIDGVQSPEAEEFFVERVKQLCA